MTPQTKTHLFFYAALFLLVTAGTQTILALEKDSIPAAISPFEAREAQTINQTRFIVHDDKIQWVCDLVTQTCKEVAPKPRSVPTNTLPTNYIQGSGVSLSLDGARKTIR